MRVECATIEEFCDELSIEANHGRIHESLVRVRIDRTPQQKECIGYDVGLVATAMVKTTEGDWLLEFAGYCGEDEKANIAGSAKARQWKKKIEEVAEGHNLMVRGGKWEVW